MDKQESRTDDVKTEIRNRDSIIVRTSIIGIVANVLLAGTKAVIGLLANSIAVVLDAVNNLSDALSSVITIAGTKLAGKKPDKKHPLGYGRIEYLSALIVAAIVLYAGITAGVESVKKIITPEESDYSVVSLVIIGIAVVVKLLLGSFFKSRGKKVNSSALTASGADAMFDAVLSASVLASAIVFVTTGVSLEAYVGVIISAFIIKSGIGMMKDTLSDILGKRADTEISREIKRIINEEPEVRGAYDLILNDYGPNKNYASVHIELPDSMTVEQVDVLTRRIQVNVYKKTGIILTGIGVYSYNTKDNEAADIRNRIQKAVLSHDWALQIHGFYTDVKEKTVRFDVVFSFDIDAHEGLRILSDEVNELCPGYSVHITPDIDASD